MSVSSSTQSAPPHSGPWWKHRLMWLVVGGPAAVVVASFVTVYLAVTHPDPVYSDAQRTKQPALQPADEAGQSSPSPSGMAPAMQARNHAATGGVAKPAPASVPPGAAQ